MNRPIRWLVLCVALLFLFVACSSSSNPSSGGTGATTTTAGAGATTTTASTAKPSGGKYKVGDTAKSSNFAITLHGVTDPFTPTSQFVQPSPGNRFVRVDIEVKNTSSRTQTFSSLALMKLKDSENKTYTEALTAEPGPSSPNGEVQPDQGIRGYTYYEVPTAATGLVLTVQGSFTAAGAQFALS